jgi:signal transduction histidine kinase/DNA-binding response OmpR family regulator
VLLVREAAVTTSAGSTPQDDGSAQAGPDLAAELQESREQLSAVNEVLSAVGRSAGDPDMVLTTIVESARRLCRADAAQLCLLDDAQVFQLIKAVGISDQSIAYIAEHPLPLDRATLMGRVALDRRPQQIEDVVADPEYGRLDLQRVAGFRTTMGAPLVVDDEVVGAIVLWRNEVSPFAEREMIIVTAFAAQAALAINGVRLVQELQAGRAELARRVDQLEALADVGEAVSSSLDVDEVLTTIVSLAVELSGTDGGSLMEFDETTQLFSVRTTFGTEAPVVEQLRATRIHLDETLVGQACLAGSPQQVEDLAVVDRDAHLAVLYAAGWRSVVAIPMLRSDRVVGAMVVRRKTPGLLTRETCEVLEAFASQSAIALTNARLYQQLELQSAELAEASQHKSEFLASMSHELRTPLNAVIGFSEVLLERMFGDLNERQEDYLRDILSSGRHLLALLNDVLDLSKVEAGHMELDPTEFAVAETVDYALSMVRERAAAHGITLSRDLGPGVDLVRADELRVKQVLLNLLSNAVKFTPDGGRVQVRARTTATHLEITVSDTGMGIDPADRQRIFDSFQQGGRAARQVEGTGLGLTLTKRIVELHGGHLWLASEVGHGSTFGFTLPLGRRLDPAGAPDRSVGAADHHDERPVVVVVEDDHRSAELMSLHLEAAGLRPGAVPNGTDGLAAVRDQSPAAVIHDIRLPGMDGWDVLGAIKGDPHTASTPVVVVSVIHERGRGFALGASDYLVKPVARDDLLAALRRLVPLPVDQAARRVAVFVDDDPLALELVRVALEPAGWVVHTCTTAEVALSLIRTHEPSVVLVDLLMPDTDGFEVVDLLRTDPQTARIPVVVLTAKTLTARDRELLDGRIEFVTSKSAVDLGLLAARLVQVTGGPVRSRGLEAG